MAYDRKRISINHPDRPDEYFDIITYDDSPKEEFAETERLYASLSEADDYVYNAIKEKENEFNTLYANSISTALWNGDIYQLPDEDMPEESFDECFTYDPREPFPDKVYTLFEEKWWLDGHDMTDYVSKEKAFYEKYGKVFLYPLTREQKIDDEVEKARCRYVHNELRPYHYPMRRCNYNPNGTPATFSTNRYAMFRGKVGSYNFPESIYELERKEHAYLASPPSSPVRPEPTPVAKGSLKDAYIILAVCILGPILLWWLISWLASL